MQKGGDPDPKKKKTSRIEPFITSDPDEYAFRKAAYDDSLHVANKYNSKQPRTSKYTLYKPIVGKSFPGKRASVKREYIPYIPRPLDTYDVSGESPAWEKFRRENMHLRDRMIENQPIGFVTEKSVYDSRAIRTPFGVKTFTLPGEHQAKEFDRKPRYKRPVQPVIFKEPVTHQEKKKPVEHKYPTSRKPVVDNTKQKPPEGKIVVGKEEVQQLDPNTGVVTTVINPVYEDAMMPIQTLPPARVNHTLQKFIGEPLPVTVQEEIPEEELLDEEIPEEEIPEEEMYGEEEVDGEYVDAGRKRLFPNIYVDTHGRKLKYTTYRLRKHGHSGDLIKKKGVDYMYFPKIERGPSTHFWMDYKQEGGAAASPFDLDPEHMKRYLADLRKQENSIRKGYKNGMWYPHASLEGGADTIAYGHKLTPNDSALRRGITEEQALKLQEQDVLKNQALAKKQVDKQFGTGTFDNLPQDSQMLLVDYQYNLGTLSGFPKFVKGVVEGNKEQMLAQHTRYGAGKPLTKRNEWTVDVINNMEIPKPYDPMGQITIPLANVPDATNVVQPVILEGPKEAIELELTPEEIKEYARGGFIVEDVSVPTLTQAQEGGSPDPKTNFYTVEGSDGVYRKVNGKWEVDWNRSGKFQPLSKGDVKERSAILNKKAKPLYDATYDDLYATQRSAYTATPKPTPAKKPTPQNKAAQEKFDKTFAVTDKSKMEVVEDKVQKGIDDFAKYHQEQTGKPLTQEEYNDAYKDIYNRAYVNAGVYKPTMSGPTINPYGTTKERKNLVSLDPGNAPKNLTLGDYVEKGWDVITNPLDYASYALKPKGTVATPWNMTNYENRLAAAGLEDPVTANNNVNKALDFASWFIGPGMVAQGLKMVPSTVNSIGRAFKDPSWENTRDALFDTGMTALSIVPGFGIAKNLAKRASTIDDLKAIEALRGNTTTTPFQSYFLTGDRALGASEAAAQQSQALRKFIEPQSLQLPAGRSPIMSESIRTQLTNPAVDSYFPVRFGDDAYTAAGKEYYSVDPEDYRIFNPETQQYEYNPNWRQEGLQDATESLDNTLSNLPSFSSESTKGLGSWEFGQFTPGWEALQEAKGFTMRGPKTPKKTDYYSDREFQDLLMNEMRYNIAKDEQKIQEALTGKKFTDEDFESISGALKPSNFRDKYLTPEQEKYVRQILFDNESVKSNPLLKENLEAALARSERIANPSAKNKPFRPGDLPMSLNSAPEILPKGKLDSKNPLDQLAALIKRKRSKSEISALDDLDTIRLQSKTGQANAEELLNAEIEQKLKDLDTPEGRRRVQKYIEDNNLVNEEYDPGNFDELAREYQAELPRILADKYSDESQRIVELVRNKMAASKRVPSLAGLKSWNELEAEHILNNPILRMQSYEAIVPADPRFTGKYIKRPFTHDEYVESIENILYKDVSEDIDRLERSIQVSENEIKQLAIEKNTLNRDLRAEQDLSMRAMIQQRIHNTNKRILDAHNRIAFNKQSMNSLGDYLNRENASFQPIDNTISFGEPYTAIGDLLSTMTHEIGHSTEMVGVPFSNSAIDRALIKNLTFRKKAPSYLYKKFDPDKARETAPSDISNQGIKKYRDPEGYFRSNLNYFKVGNKMVVGDSNEPTAFAVEMRPALKELGLIKGNFDIVTPETIEKLYVEYITNPKFQFRDLRIFDIMEPTKKNFKELAKQYNDIKSLLPYAVPVGLGVGVTGLAGQEEMQQDMEYQDGGIIMELSDDEIEQYKKGGWVIEEVYDDGGTTPDLNQFFTVPAKQKVTTKPVVKPAVEPIKRNIQPVNNNEGINQFFTVPTKQTIKNESGVKPVRTIEDISINEILNKYNVSGQSPFLTTADLGNLPKYSEPVEKKKVQSKKPEQIIEDVSVIDILNKYNVSGQSPFLTNEDLQSLPKYTSPKEDVDKRFEQGKKKIKESEAKDSSILEIAGILTNPIMDYFTGPIETGYELAGDAYDLVVNGLKRKARTYGVIDDSDAKVDPLYKTAPLTIDQYYTNQNPIRQQVLEVPDGNGRTFKQQVVPLSNITLGYRNRGEYDNIKTPGLELTTFHPFVSNPKDVKENTSVFAIDDKGNLHTGSYGEFKNNKGWKFSRTYMNKITDITSDFVDGSVSGNPGYKQPKVKVLENGKEKSGSLNILTKGPGKEDYYGSIQGGRVLFVNPKTKEQFLVSGSAQHIRTEFKRLKGNAPYLEAWTLDNGTYSRGLSYKDGKLTPERLKKYDNENTSGGSGLYILDYKAPVTKNKYQESYVKNSPNVRTVNSESYRSGRPLKNEIKNVVLHHTAFTDEATSEKGVYNHFMNPKSNASAHVVIERNGKRTVYASPEQVAFHSGVSSWNGRKNVNDFAIGVEFQGDTNKMPLTDAQIESFVEYYAPIAERYNLSIKDIITHAMIAPGRKPDITDKEYKRILNYMKQQGYK
jgi:hypothetical protein